MLPNFGVRTGVVWRGERTARDEFNANRPFAAFNVPVTVPDPGPDGVRGNADDGGRHRRRSTWRPSTSPAGGQHLRQRAREMPTTTRGSSTATKRMSNRWSVMFSFSHTWSEAQNNSFFGTGLPAEPAADHAERPDQHRARRQDQVHRLVAEAARHLSKARGALKISPMLRHQGGQNFGRTFTAMLNYGTVRIAGRAARDAAAGRHHGRRFPAGEGVPRRPVCSSGPSSTSTTCSTPTPCRT